MKVAIGLKAHSGWAVLVALGTTSGDLCVADRRRIELVDDNGASRYKQPYHAAARLRPVDASAFITRCTQSVHRAAIRELRAAVRRTREANHELAGCAVLMADPMPKWSVEEILAVHFRMHKAEGVLFREALARAATACRVRLVEISEQGLDEEAQRTLAVPVKELRMTLAALGKSVGPPWGKDQKDASLAALTALHYQRWPGTTASRQAARQGVAPDGRR